MDLLNNLYSMLFVLHPVLDSLCRPTNFLVVLRLWLFRQQLNRIPGDELSVLDVGGGSGWLLSLIREACPRVKQTHEVDLDETAGEQARALGHQFHAMRIEEFQSTRPFDLIVMLNLIEHVESPAAVLEAMRQLLSENGRLILKTPNFKTLDQRLFEIGRAHV